MDNKFNNFDDIIKNKLAQLDLSNELPDWNAFEEKLDTAHQENTSFDDDSFVDELSHAKLANKEAPYQPEHWVQMSERIELDRILTRKLIKYKLIEAVLVVFAIFTFINLFPVRKEIKHNLKEKIELLQNKIESQNNQNIYKATPKTDAKPTKPMAAVTPKKDVIRFAKKKEDVSTPVSSDDNSIAETKTVIAVTQKVLSPVAMITPTFTIEEHKSSPLCLTAPNHKIIKKTTDERETQNIQGLETLAMLSDNAISLMDGPGETVLSLLKSKVRKKNVFSFSGIAGMDANYINTPYDGISDVKSDTTAAVGYSGGFNFNMQMSRIGIQTGLIYSFKRYQPNTPTDILQAQNFKFKEEFKGIELDIVQIPLNIRYDYYIKDRSRLYVLGGASLNTIARANYDILYKQENSLAAPPNPAQFAYAREQSDLNKKDFEKGVFGGGKFADNAFITANFSLGLEQYVSPRISFFLQPRFQYYFPFQDGVGPNNDKIHTYSILLGTKVNVW